jgi:signal transduction histidine kinase
LSTGRFELSQSQSVFNLSQLAEDIVNELKPTLAQANCEIDFVTTGPNYVRADRDRIGQVITNLIMNAKKYAPGKIETRVFRQDKNACFEIVDHGPGIAPEYQISIFERFERAPQTNPVGGLGLGLYISREILRSHGGELTLKSQLGEGARFHFCLALE